MVKVSDAIVAFEKALVELKALNPDTEVVGNFDEGGYCGDAEKLKKMYISINDVQEANIVELTVGFIS
jgi:hypothetical protein